MAYNGMKLSVFYLRNRKYFPCFHTVIETRVEVWENEKLKWEREHAGRVFPRYFEFSKTFTSVSIFASFAKKKVLQTLTSFSIQTARPVSL